MFPITLPVRKVYPAQGRCIYCGSTDPPLTLEHIVPFALDGRLELPEASCGDCQKKTWWADTETLQKLLVGPRRALKTRRRKKKGSPGIPPMATASGTTPPEKLGDFHFHDDMPEDERPVAILLPVMPRPTLLGGDPVPLDEGILTFALSICYLRPPPPTPEGQQTAVLTSFNPSALMRMLAKIAHSAAVAELGLGSFEPVLTDYILGRRGDFSRIIGKTPLGRFKRDRTVDVSLHMRGEYIWARIQLFAQHRTGSYAVAVGKPTEPHLWISGQSKLIAARYMSRWSSVNAAHSSPCGSR